MMQVRRIWTINRDLPEQELKRGDLVAELTDGRFFMRREIKPVELSAHAAAPMDPLSVETFETAEFAAALHTHLASSTERTLR
jgi:hypothetical protein